MTDAFWTSLPAIVIALATIPGSIATVVIALRAERKAEEHTAALKQGQADIKVATDGMKDALVAAAIDKGKQLGKEEEQAKPTTQSVPIVDGGRRVTDQQ